MMVFWSIKFSEQHKKSAKIRTPEMVQLWRQRRWPPKSNEWLKCTPLL